MAHMTTSLGFGCDVHAGGERVDCNGGWALDFTCRVKQLVTQRVPNN